MNGKFFRKKSFSFFKPCAIVRISCIVVYTRRAQNDAGFPADSGSCYA